MNVAQDESCATCDVFNFHSLLNFEKYSYFIPKIVVEAIPLYFEEAYIDLKTTTLSLRGPPSNTII